MLFWSISRRGGIISASALMLAVNACGTAPEDPSSGTQGVELTFVGMVQFSTPIPAGGDPQPPSAQRVTADVTLVFRFADHPQTVVIDFKSQSGLSTHNEVDLASVAPEVVAASRGRWVVRAPLLIPETGNLRFHTVLVDQSGLASTSVDGDFTVQSSLGASNTDQGSVGTNTTTVSR
jgi:hypothetical protein